MPTRDKIYVSKSERVQKIYAQLTDDKGAVPSNPFRFERDVFMAAVAFGFAADQTTPLEPAERKDKFTWSTLLNDTHALSTLRAIALIKTGQPDVLLDDDYVANLAEGYANAGVHILAKRL